jgi:hypothetical protein
VGQNDCVGDFALNKRALELAAFKPADRTAQNAASIAATADRSVKPAYDEENLGERTLTDYRRSPTHRGIGGVRIFFEVKSGNLAFRSELG